MVTVGIARSPAVRVSPTPLGDTLIDALTRARAAVGRMAKALRGDVSELKRARDLRREADLKAPRSERPARVHALCKQMSAIKGAAGAR